LAASLAGLGGLCVWPGSVRGADDPPGAYKAESPEPSPAETLILEYVNRCRLDPAEDAIRCLQTAGVPNTVDFNMFKQEMLDAKPAPPLVFDLTLLKAARWHSYYQILNGQTHDEEQGKKGYTGQSLSERIRLAGFTDARAGENIFRTAKNLWYCHAAFVIDWGQGPGGMQPERGHRRNILNSDFNVAGIGAVLWPRAEDFAVTQDFGGSKRRMLGGVVYNDANHNRAYDIGEGVGGVAISAGTAQTKSWASGAYAVELPQTKAKLTVGLKGDNYVCSLPDGHQNVKFDVLVSDLALFKRGTKLLAAAKKIPESKKGPRFAALVDLYLSTRDTLVEEDTLEEIASLVEEVHEVLDKDMAAVREAVGGDASEESSKQVQAVARKYAHTKAESWFNDALTCVKMNATYLRLKAMREGNKPVAASLLDRVVKDQQKKFSKLTVPEWRKVGMDLTLKTAAAGGSGAAEAKPGSP
jgi:hypothetical protein